MSGELVAIPPAAAVGPYDGWEVINHLVDLIKIGLGLDDAHCVTYNQMIPIPPDETMFVAVGILDTKPFGGIGPTTYDASTVTPTGEVIDALNESQTSNTRDVYSIHIMSRNNDARARRQLVKLALTGIRSIQRQEAFGFVVGKIPVGFADASITDGAERLNRYVLTIAVLGFTSADAPVEFYDQFPGSPALVTQQ